MTQPSNPLPSELREVVSDVLKNHDPLHPGDCDDQERLLAAFEQEYQRRCEAAKPEKVDPGLIWGERVANGYNRSIEQYYTNLMQLSKGGGDAPSATTNS